MADYIDFGIETDPTELALIAFEHLKEQVPGWLPSPGNFEAILIEAAAMMAAEERDVAAVIPKAIFRIYGEELVQLPPVDATPATASSTWTVIDDSGYTIPAGTLVGVRAAGDELIVFRVVYDVVVPPGSTETAAGEVALEADTPGISGSGLSGSVELVDSLDFFSSAVLVGSTSGGADAETEDEYLSRLVEEMKLLTRRPILPVDFEILARRQPGVERAMAIDGYDPGDSSSNNERMITVAVVDAAGQPLSSPAKAAVDAALQAEREVNFEVFVIDPTYTEIDVDYEAVCYPQYVAAEVEASVDAAIAQFLNPANWGLPPFGDQKLWINQNKVRLLEVAQVINNVDGVHYITSLEIAEGGGTLGTADVDLDGAAPMPTAGDITGTITQP